MTKFIEVHDHIINIKSISKVEFISDDIYLGDFPLDANDSLIPFVFARLETLSGEKIDLIIDLYYLEENQTEDEWYEHNRRVIKVSWDQLVKTLGDITKVTGYEYKFN